MDFGTIGMKEKRDLYFALINKGPVKVVLRGWGGNITGRQSFSKERERERERLFKHNEGYQFSNKTSLKLIISRQLKLYEC